MPVNWLSIHTRTKVTWTEYTRTKVQEGSYSYFRHDRFCIGGVLRFSASSSSHLRDFFPACCRAFFLRGREVWGGERIQRSERSRIRALSCSSGPGREEMCKAQLLLLLLLCAAGSTAASANTNQQDGKFFFVCFCVIHWILGVRTKD